MNIGVYLISLALTVELTSCVLKWLHVKVWQRLLYLLILVMKSDILVIGRVLYKKNF